MALPPRPASWDPEGDRSSVLLLGPAILRPGSSFVISSPSLPPSRVAWCGATLPPPPQDAALAETPTL